MPLATSSCIFTKAGRYLWAKPTMIFASYFLAMSTIFSASSMVVAMGFSR
jgi:hypothetical protein